MKQLKFFASMTLLALAASCSNDAIDEKSLTTSPEGRPEADFVLTINETRANFGSGNEGTGWYFEKGDKIGAMLMDKWDGNGEEMNNFSIVDYAQTNYPVIRQENGEWTVHEDINALAGNYFFYFPYEPVTNARGKFGFSINPVQPQFDENGKLYQYAAVKENQRWIGYNFVPVKEFTGEKTNVKMDFVPLFAMPTFQFTNKAGDLIVDKVVVRATDDLNVDMYDKNKNRLIATTMAFLPGSGNFDSQKNDWEGYTKEEKTWNMWNHAVKYTSGGSMGEQYNLPLGKNGENMSWTPNGTFYPLNASATDTYTKQAPAYEFVADYTGVEGGYIVSQFGKINAMLVMPAGTYNVDGLEAMIHVRPVSSPEDKYVVRIPLGLKPTADDDAQAAAGRNYLEAGLIDKTRTMFYGQFDAAAMKSFDITKAQITSTEDLIWAIEEAEEFTGTYKLMVNTTGSRVQLTKEVEDILVAKPNINLYINGKITIAADASENAINLLYFNDNGAVSGTFSTDLTIVNKQVAEKNIAGLSRLTVTETGHLVSQADYVDVYYVAKDGDVNNDGTIECKLLKADNIYNNGIIKANRLEIQKVINNQGDISVTNDIFVYDEIQNYGSLVAKNVKNSATSGTGGNIDNYSDLNVSGTVLGTIYNEGTATVGTVAWKKEFTNKGSATVGEVSHFDNQRGTMNLTGKSSIFEGKNSATLNINNEYAVNKLDNFGTVNVNANVKVNGKLTNNYESTINVVAELATVNNGEVYSAGIINVTGKLVNKVYVNGIVNVIENGLVIIEGNWNDGSDSIGVIDVTEANASETSQAAKCGDNIVEYQYTVQDETDAVKLENALKTRISANNYGKNPVTLIWNSNSESTFQGVALSGNSNVTYVQIKRDLTLAGATRFAEAKVIDINTGYTLTLGNGTGTQGFNVGKAEVRINGTVKANNHSVLAPADAWCTGIGTFYAANATVQWNFDDFNGTKY